MATWQVQQAKSRFSEVLEAAETGGPQIITKHGTETAVVLSIEEYRTLRNPTTQLSFVDYLLSGPKLTDEEHEAIFGSLRDPKDTGRNVDHLFEDEQDDAA
jgi:antitoxin Phd